jgi:hypothetical protein
MIYPHKDLAKLPFMRAQTRDERLGRAQNKTSKEPIFESWKHWHTINRNSDIISDIISAVLSNIYNQQKI